MMRAPLYGRVSTFDQEPENQLVELRRYVAAREWTAAEFVDRGISGAKDHRPALDKLLAAARRRKIDAVVVWKLDRLGRSLKHLVAIDLHFHDLRHEAGSRWLEAGIPLHHVKELLGHATLVRPTPITMPAESRSANP
jgi:integrase